MKRFVMGMVAGGMMVVGAAAYGQDESASGERVRLQEVDVSAGGRAMFTVPSAYGRLVDVAVNAEVHYLYFEDPQGVIRMVLVGPRGAAPRSRLDLQLLSPQVYVVERAAAPAS